MKDDQKDQNSINQSQEHRAVPSSESQATSQSDADPSRCRDCEGDIDTGWVTLCSLHVAALGLYTALKGLMEIAESHDKWLYKEELEAARAALALVNTQDTNTRS